jgi:oligopeptide/dipeptide ABC transporter ATP-binding protein
MAVSQQTRPVGDAEAYTGPLLDVRDLRTHFFVGRSTVVKAVDGVSFTVDRGEALGIIGESGSGKSVTSRSILRVVDAPGRVVGGQVMFKGRDLLQLSERDMRDVRGRQIGIIFQDPTTSFDPVFTIGQQLTETVLAHRRISRDEAREQVLEALRLVGVGEGERVLKQYPVDFSAGFRQRLFIAMAMVLKPDLLIADEPTTTLGVTVQAEILANLKAIQQQLGTAIILITHDFGVVSQVCSKIMVMYAGRAAEYASKRDVLTSPRHPYTVGLIRSVPLIETRRARRMNLIPGFPPDMTRLPPGCAFAPRCERAQDLCRREVPSLFAVDEQHGAACYFPHPAGAVDVEKVET